MGFDLTGRSGNYFRASVWSWRPITEVIRKAHPAFYHSMGDGLHYNDGAHVNEMAATSLADALFIAIESGDVQRWLTDMRMANDATPDEPCQWCNATGIRTDSIGVQMGMPTHMVPVTANHHRAGQIGWCNGCNGKGSERPLSTSYGTDIDHVRELATFARQSNGFEIW